MRWILTFSSINNRIQDDRWQYDQAGNVTRNWSYETILYDAENRQVAFCRQDPGSCINEPGPGRTLYAYDGLGRRVKRTDPNGAVTLFLYDAFGRLAAEYSTSSTAAGTRDFTGDHLGSARLVTGMQTERHDYLPFGTEYTPATGNWRLNTDVVTGYGVDTVRQKFTGQERDSETTLDFFQARYFSAPQGRFTSPDPGNAGASLYDPQSWNGYAYVSNNPLNNTDPDGLGIFGDIGSIIGTIFPGVGTLLGWGIGSIADLATGQSISPPGVIGVGTDIFRSIAGSVNNGQPWNEQWTIGGGGWVNTGTVFGSGNTGPFIFSLQDQTTIGPVVLPQGNYPLLGPMVGWGKSVIYSFVDLLSLGRPTYVGQRVLDAMQPRTQQELRGWNASQLYAAFALIPTRSADSYLTGTLKRSPSYASEYGMKTIKDLEDLAKSGNQKAQKMLKLVKQATRLQGKVGGKP